MFMIQVDIDKCEACGDCIDTCPQGSLVMTETDGKDHVEFIDND